MPELHEIMRAIAEPVSEADIKQLPREAGGHPYIPWQAAYGRMDAATGKQWDYSIISATEQAGFAVVHLRLRVWDNDGQVRDVEELASVSLDTRAPAFEVATRSAVKRAMSVWGYARNLWQGHDHGQDFDHYSQNRPAQVHDRPSQNGEGRPPYQESQRQEVQPPAGGFPEGQCQQCGRGVNQRNDGTYWRYCYDCNEQRRAA